MQPTGSSPEPLPDALVEVDGLAFEYGAYLALRDVSFDLEEGEIVVLVGRNGAGKSTLLRAVAGWSRIADGDVRLLGVSTRRDERRLREHLVLVPDRPDFYDDLTTWEHLQFVANVNRRKGWEPRAEALLRRFGLWSRRQSYPFTYSLGMRYKLALCMALLLSPAILLCDEPFGLLDPVSASDLWADLDEQRSNGTAVLLSSHNLPAEADPDRYLVLEQGQVIAEGTPEELRESLGLGSRFSLDELLRAAIGALPPEPVDDRSE